MTPASDRGFILINVLVVLGLAATIVYAMLTLSDLSLARSQRFSEAAQGLALVRAGEQSAIAALRRDMIEAPELDYPAEPWSRVAQEAIDIAGGSFALQIEDAQSRLNLNVLTGQETEEEQLLQAIFTAVGLQPELASQLLASLEADGPLRHLEDLSARIGLMPQDVAALGAMVTVLPGTGEVNINSAPSGLIAVLVNDPALAAILVGRRDSVGFLTPEDLDSTGVILPADVGFQSNLFRLRTSVRIGDTTQSFESLLRRREGTSGPEAAVIYRQSATEPASRAPPNF